MADFRESVTLAKVPKDDVGMLPFKQDQKSTLKSVHASVDNIETTPLAISQRTPNQPMNSFAKSSTINIEMMTIKPCFMNKI